MFNLTTNFELIEFGKMSFFFTVVEKGDHFGPKKLKEKF